MRNQERLGFHVDFGLNINSLQWVMRINIFINHVCAHYDGENRLFKIHLHGIFNSGLPFSAVAFGKTSSVLAFIRKLFPYKQFYWFQDFVGWALKQQMKRFSLRVSGEEKMQLQFKQGMVLKWPMEVGA